MHNYDDRLELAPRDVVSHAIVHESRKQNSTEFYLDITHKDADFLIKRFPMIYRNLLDQGFDLTKDRIPIFPCQHYLMGGINVDRNAQTKIKGLYAVGECSHTGVHGNNRLARNSLLEALVFSRQAANHIAAACNDVPDNFEEHVFEVNEEKPEIPAGIRTEVRRIMQESSFVIPDREAAVRGFERVKEIRRLLHSEDFRKDTNYIEANSLVTVAYLILKEVI
jgi:L-aspartate oxidase